MAINYQHKASTTAYSTKTVLTTAHLHATQRLQHQQKSRTITSTTNKHATKPTMTTTRLPIPMTMTSNPPNEPVPQVITEGISETADEVLIFKNCLLDSGGTKSLIPLSRLPKGLIKHQSSQPYCALSSSGVHHHHEHITLSKIRFPQFSTNIRLENVDLIIFDDSKHCAYDIIIGLNIIQQFGFIINFANNETSCLNVTLPFLQRNTKPSTEPITVQNFINDTIPTTTSTNLTHDQTHQLNTILTKFSQLFNNDIGKSTHQARLQLIDPHTTPIHSKPFSIPNNHSHHCKQIITDSVKNNVLRRIISSNWAFPSFLVPKKNGTFRLVSEFSRLPKPTLTLHH